jgi:hypothetical protein
VKTGRLCIAGLVVVLFILTLAPFSLAQITPELLNQKWFMVSMSLKGYQGWGNDRIDSAYSGSRKNIYIYSTYDPGQQEFTWMTCTPDSTGSTYTPWPLSRFHIGWIYGESYPKQIWDHLRYRTLDSGDVLKFFNGSEDIMLVPILTMDIKLDGNYAFKSASFKTTACIAHWGDVQNNYVGSCKLSGKTVSADKVPQAALDACGP